MGVANVAHAALIAVRVANVIDRPDRKMRKIIIKLGGAVITHKGCSPPQANIANIQRLAHEIGSVYRSRSMSLVIVHGAGCFGHIPAQRYRITKDQWHEGKRTGVIEIRQAMEQLNQVVTGALVAAGLPCIAFQSSAASLLNAKKLVEFPVTILTKFCERQLIPVTYGDVAVDLQNGVDILSGDQIVSYLGKAMLPDLVVIGTDVDGVFSKNPQKYPSARLITEIDDQNAATLMPGLEGSRHVDVTGGMAQKIQELLKLAYCGIPSKVVNADKPGRIAQALANDECPGTWIKALSQIIHEPTQT